MQVDDDGAFTGGFSTDTMNGAVLQGSVDLWTDALFRRDRRLGQRNNNAARRMDALVVMSRIAAGATPAEITARLGELRS